MAVDSNQVTRALQTTTEKVHTFLKNPQQSTRERREALAAAKSLVRELQDGEDAHFTQFENVGSAFILHALLGMGVIKAMPETGTIPIDELASRMNSSSDLITRLMRLVVATGVFAEPQVGRFAHTSHSRLYIDPGHAAWHELIIALCTPTWAKLPEYYATHERVSPTDMKSNPLTFTSGSEGEDWHMIYARSPEMLHKFVLGMSSTVNCVPVFGAYPFGEQLLTKSEQADREGGVFLVDVGASDGSITKAIQAKYPELKGKIVIQDQKRVIDSIPPGSLPEGFEAMVADFWKPQPVKAKVYYLRRIMHDWPDKECALILANQVAAMDEDSIVLISETVIPEKTQNVDTYPYWIDLIMLQFAGRERTAKHWRKVFDMSGLELIKIWEPDVGFQCMLEGRKKRKEAV